jgi:pimeloyl-ACP methyl ester carboxylesterase
MLHGSGNTGVLWEGQVAGLADVANVIAVDLAGHGDSELSLVDSVREHVSSIAGLIDALDVSPAIVCGLSLGGAIALQILLDHPDRVAAGVLIGTGARLRVSPVILKMIEQDFAGFVNSMPMVAASPGTDGALLEPLMQAVLKNGADVSARGFRICDDFDVMERLGEIERPVLVVSGENDQLTPPKYGRYLAEHIAEAKLVMLSDARHLSPLERPDTVNRVIREWLEENDLSARFPRKPSPTGFQ